jgi:hypothetical protein
LSSSTIAYGVVLTALGVGGYHATGRQSKTALIPAAFGVAAIGLGLLARSGRMRTPALAGAAIVGVGGLLGSARGLAKLPAVLRGEEVERPAAVIAQSVMAGVSAIYLASRVMSALR